MTAYNPIVYRLSVFCVKPLFRLYFKLRSLHTDRVPITGPFILCANHTSYLDPIFIGLTLPRPIRFMMLKTYYDIFPIGMISSLWGAFPVDGKGITRFTFRNTETVLREGGVLGIFPEGGRSRDGKLKSGKPGAMLLAMRERVPVVPAAIHGAFEAYPASRAFPRPRPISVHFGKPLTTHLKYSYPADKKHLQKLTNELMESIRKLQTTREKPESEI